MFIMEGLRSWCNVILSQFLCPQMHNAENFEYQITLKMTKSMTSVDLYRSANYIDLYIIDNVKI